MSPAVLPLQLSLPNANNHHLIFQPVQKGGVISEQLDKRKMHTVCFHGNYYINKPCQNLATEAHARALWVHFPVWHLSCLCYDQLKSINKSSTITMTTMPKSMFKYHFYVVEPFQQSQTHNQMQMVDESKHSHSSIKHQQYVQTYKTITANCDFIYSACVFMKCSHHK